VTKSSRQQHHEKQWDIEEVQGGEEEQAERSSSSRGRRKEGICDLIRVPYYPQVFVAGLIFDFARISMSFIGPFYINQATHSPRLVQLTGSATWGCLLLGPCFGILSDRLDRRRTVLLVLITELCLSSVVGLLLAAEKMRPLFMLLYMLSAGVCRVLDTTTRPALVYDILHRGNSEHMVGTAMALRQVGGNIGFICGNQLVGYAIQTLGLSFSCFLVASLCATALCLLLCVPSPPKAAKRGAKKAKKAASGVWAELSAGFSMAWHDAAFMSMLGVTFLMNFFWSPFVPSLQLVATNLDATPYRTGLLASAIGCGGVVASIAIALTNPRRTGVIYSVSNACAWTQPDVNITAHYLL
jgi:MFS family permease